MPIHGKCSGQFSALQCYSGPVHGHICLLESHSKSVTQEKAQNDLAKGGSICYVVMWQWWAQHRSIRPGFSHGVPMIAQRGHAIVTCRKSESKPKIVEALACPSAYKSDLNYRDSSRSSTRNS